VPSQRMVPGLLAASPGPTTPTFVATPIPSQVPEPHRQEQGGI